MVKKVEEVVIDLTAWMLDNDVANFVLLHQKEVLYMCMVSGILSGREVCIDTLELDYCAISYIIFIFISIHLGYTFIKLLWFTHDIYCSSTVDSVS